LKKSVHGMGSNSQSQLSSRVIVSQSRCCHFTAVPTVDATQALG